MNTAASTHDATLQHASDWAGEDIGGWYCSEKLDGVRLRWTGTALVTRGGRVLADVPAFVVADLPRGLVLDGELWAGRGGFEVARRAVQYGGNDWHDVRGFHAFDAPEVAGDWAQRMAAVRAHAPLHVAASRVHHATELRARLRALHAAGGEGFMVAKPGAPYRAGRVTTLLKFKHPELCETRGPMHAHAGGLEPVL